MQIFPEIGKLFVQAHRSNNKLMEVLLQRIIGFMFFLGYILISGCQVNPNEPLTPLTATSRPATVLTTQGVITMPALVPTPDSANLQILINRTKEDLANRLSIAVEEIVLAEITEVEWSDSSLDCPQPGMSYLQVVTPGYRILLQVNDRFHEYHSNEDSFFVYCESQSPPAPLKP